MKINYCSYAYSAEYLVLFDYNMDFYNVLVFVACCLAQSFANGSFFNNGFNFFRSQHFCLKKEVVDYPSRLISMIYLWKNCEIDIKK